MEVKGVVAKAAVLLAVAGGILLLFWHAETLRLRPDGVSLAWVVIVAGGVGALARRAGTGGTALGMTVGALAGVGGMVLALKVFPVTAMGSGIALGLAALVAGALLLALPGLDKGASAAAFGVAVAAVQLVRLDASSGVPEALAVWTTVVLALLLGLLAVQGSALLGARRAQTPPPPLEVMDLEAPAGSVSSLAARRAR